MRMTDGGIAWVTWECMRPYIPYLPKDKTLSIFGEARKQIRDAERRRTSGIVSGIMRNTWYRPSVRTFNDTTTEAPAMTVKSKKSTR